MLQKWPIDEVSKRGNNEQTVVLDLFSGGENHRKAVEATGIRTYVEKRLYVVVTHSRLRLLFVIGAALVHIRCSTGSTINELTRNIDRE